MGITLSPSQQVSKRKRQCEGSRFLSGRNLFRFQLSGPKTGLQFDDFGEFVFPSCFLKLTDVASMFQLYQSMVTIMKEKCANSEKINHLVPEVMNGVLMSALNEMYNYPNMFPTFTDTVQALPFLKYVFNVLFEHTHALHSG